ncbi:ABC transporter permease [Nitrospira sp. NS4]|uniref:ABC transporter permease n=1 Tax=Nitrospira sp. NS4 TaxID=3414498 RepID=UPI003C2E4808
MTTLRQHLSSPLQLMAIATAGLILLPLGYVTLLAVTADPAVWSRLWATRIPELLFNTVSLAGAVALLTLILGVSTAWLVVRFDFPGRRLWEAALILPLAMPTYVLAYVYTYLLGFGGPVEQVWQLWAGPQSRIVSPQSFWGTTLVMALDTFPFVYLLTRTALLSLNVSFEEVARVSGVSRMMTLWRVTLPLMRPSIAAGVALVVLYVVSDFGAVSLLRYQTLTYAVFQQMTGRSDNTAASILSVLLVVLALLFLVTERWFRQRSRFYQTTGRYRPPQRIRCRWIGTLSITALLGGIVAMSFGVPAFLLVKWSLSPEALAIIDSRFYGFVWNSALLAAAAATAGVFIGLPLAYLASRRPTLLNLGCLQAAYAGYVLPGPVAALAVLVLCLKLMPIFYGTVLLLIVAYVIHFLPAGLQSLEPALQQITPNLEEVARTLGLGVRETWRRVTLPLVRNGFIVAWVLMFLQTMKELPATLLLRPVGFDTLAIRVWLEASEEYFQLAAPSALLIVLLSLPALWLLVSKDWRTS